MTIMEARQILGVTVQDDLKTIKSSFRRLMAQYHPDAVGAETDAVLQRAQEINEAYTVLRKTLAESEEIQEGTSDKTTRDRDTRKRAASGKDRAGAGKREPVRERRWEGQVIADAFVERRVYRPLFLSSEEEGAGYVAVARGRYAWDPETETFPCLLHSINEAAIELLESMEHKAMGSSDTWRYDHKEMEKERFPFQIRLFHLLAGQFILPAASLRKLARPEKTDVSGKEIYRLRAFLGTKERRDSKVGRALTRLEKGELLYAASLKDERLVVADREGTLLGPLSFAEDMWYYIAFPILQAHNAQVKLVVDGVTGESGRRKPGRSCSVRVDVDMYLRMEPPAEPGCEPAPGLDWNRQIRAVLEDYSLMLDTLSKA